MVRASRQECSASGDLWAWLVCASGQRRSAPTFRCRTVQAVGPSSAWPCLGRRRRHPMIRLLLADDHAVVREGLRRLLEEKNGLSVIGEAGTVPEVLEQLRKTPVDVL